MYNLLDDWARAEKCGYVFSAQTGLNLNEHNYLDPDLVYLQPHQVPQRDGERVTSAALAAEVISPSNFRALGKRGKLASSNSESLRSGMYISIHGVRRSAA